MPLSAVPASREASSEPLVGGRVVFVRCSRRPDAVAAHVHAFRRNVIGRDSNVAAACGVPRRAEHRSAYDGARWPCVRPLLDSIEGELVGA
jgi:hypothetical protein